MNLPEIIGLSLFNRHANNAHTVVIIPPIVLTNCGQDRSSVVRDATESLDARLQSKCVEAMILEGEGMFTCTLLASPKGSVHDFAIRPSESPMYTYYEANKPSALNESQDYAHVDDTVESICSGYQWSKNLELPSDLLSQTAETIGRIIVAIEKLWFCRIQPSGELTFRKLTWVEDNFEHEDILS